MDAFVGRPSIKVILWKGASFQSPWSDFIFSCLMCSSPHKVNLISISFGGKKLICFPEADFSRELWTIVGNALRHVGIWNQKSLLLFFPYGLTCILRITFGMPSKLIGPWEQCCWIEIFQYGPHISTQASEVGFCRWECRRLEPFPCFPRSQFVS